MMGQDVNGHDGFQTGGLAPMTITGLNEMEL